MSRATVPIQTKQERNRKHIDAHEPFFEKLLISEIQPKKRTRNAGGHQIQLNIEIGKLLCGYAYRSQYYICIPGHVKYK